LILGLDGAGKTTILYQLRCGEVVTTIPSNHENCRCCCFCCERIDINFVVLFEIFLDSIVFLLAIGFNVETGKLKINSCFFVFYRDSKKK
jgi:GTPase SAR1 family protein